MHALQVGPAWGSQIAIIRDAETDDTNLIRFDNTFYRLCRAGGGTFTVMLGAASAPTRPPVQMQFRAQDLYVLTIAGQPMGRYASTIDLYATQAAGIDSALLELPTATGTRRFELQSLLVFCVAESLRSNSVATLIEQTIRTTTVGLVGGPTHLPMGELLPLAHAWGQTSDAIHAALSPRARAIVAQPRAALRPEDREYSERVDLARVDPAVREYAKRITVLKRPG